MSSITYQRQARSDIPAAAVAIAAVGQQQWQWQQYFKECRHSWQLPSWWAQKLAI
jgi:hypothetical protein